MSFVSTKNLLIKYVRSQYSAQYIADALYNANIAMVSKITLVPDIIRGFNTAFVVIDMWICSDNGCKSLSDLHSPEKEFSLDHNGNQQDAWVVKLNNYNDGNFYIQGQTTTFNNPWSFLNRYNTLSIYENKFIYDSKPEDLKNTEDLEDLEYLEKNVWTYPREVEYTIIDNYKNIL